MMKRQAILYKLAVFFLLLLFPLVAEAQEYGISGQLQLTYMKDIFDIEDSITDRWSIEQRYTLNYKKFIYHPKLLTYSLSGTFVKENGESDGAETEAENKDYDLRLDFISATPYPFSLWTSKLTTTSFLPQSTGPSLFVKQTLQGFGLEGSVRRLRYSLSQEDRKVTGEGEPVDGRTRDFSLGLSKRWEMSTMNLNYNLKNTLDRIKSEEGDDHNLNFFSRTRLSRPLSLSESAWFHTNTLTETTKISSSTRLEYIPTYKFRGNMSLSYKHTKQPEGTLESLSTSANSIYKISNAFTVSGNTSVYYNRDNLSKGTGETIGGSLGYFSPIAKDLTISAATSLGIGAFQGEPVDKTTFNSGASSRLSKNFPNIKSTLSTGGSVGYSTSSAGSKNANYVLNLTANSNYIEKLTAQSQLRYSGEKTTPDRIDSEPVVTTSRRTLTSDTSLTYFMLLGRRTKLDMKAGVLIEEGTTDRGFYYTEETLRRRFRRNLFMRSVIKYMHEEIAPSDTIRGSINFDYRIRRIFVNLWYEVWNQKKIDTTSTKHSVFLQVRRTF